MNFPSQWIDSVVWCSFGVLALGLLLAIVLMVARVFGVRVRHTEVLLLLVFSAGGMLSVPLLAVQESRPMGLLLMLGVAVIATAILTNRANHQSGGAPAVQLHWGGFGGGVQGLHVEAHGFLGLLTLIGASFWLSSVYVAIAAPSPKTSETTKLKDRDATKHTVEQVEVKVVSPLPKIEFGKLDLPKLNVDVEVPNPIAVKVDPIKVDDVNVNRIDFTPIDVNAVKIEQVEVKPISVSTINVEPVKIQAVDVNPITVNRLTIDPLEVQKVEVAPIQVELKTLITPCQCHRTTPSFSLIPDLIPGSRR